jgi:hypothetical protein
LDISKKTGFYPLYGLIGDNRVFANFGTKIAYKIVWKSSAEEA